MNSSVDYFVDILVLMVLSIKIKAPIQNKKLENLKHLIIKKVFMALVNNDTPVLEFPIPLYVARAVSFPTYGA